MKRKITTDKDYHYNKIDTALKSYEENKPWHQYTTGWICDRIEWSWKWHHITEEQMKELTNRIIEILRRP